MRRTPPPAPATGAGPVPTGPSATRTQLPPWFGRAVLVVLLSVAGFLVVAWAAGRLASFLGMIFLAWLLGISMEPLVDLLERKGMRRGAATGLVMAGVALLFAAFLGAFGALLVEQVVDLVRALPDAVTAAVGWLNSTFNLALDTSNLPETLGLTPAKVQELVTRFTPGVLGVLTSVVGGVFQGVTLLFFAYYMSAQGPQLRRLVASWFPPRQQPIISTVWQITVDKTGGYVTSRLVLAVVSAAATGVVLVLLGVPYWLPMAIWTGVVSQFIPSIGTYIGIALPALIALTEQPIDALWVVVFGVTYQGVENYLISPRITARTVSIHPALAFASVIAGAAMFGAIGALVSVPVAAAIQSVVQTYGRRYELVGEAGAGG